MCTNAPSMCAECSLPPQHQHAFLQSRSKRFYTSCQALNTCCLLVHMFCEGLSIPARQESSRHHARCPKSCATPAATSARSCSQAWSVSNARSCSEAISLHRMLATITCHHVATYALPGCFGSSPSFEDRPNCTPCRSTQQAITHDGRPWAGPHQTYMVPQPFKGCHATAYCYLAYTEKQSGN